MKIKKKIKLFQVLSVLMFLLAGCSSLEEPIQIILRPRSGRQQQSIATAKRFQESTPSEQTAIDSAVNLKKEITELTEKIEELNQQNQDLTEKNLQLEEHIGAIEPELAQTRKELEQANDVLVKMNIELNNWKTDILGYRNEMREAQKTQLEALLKVFELLGGKARDEAPANRQVAVVPSGEISQAQLKERPRSNE